MGGWLRRGPILKINGGLRKFYLIRSTSWVEYIGISELNTGGQEVDDLAGIVIGGSWNKEDASLWQIKGVLWRITGWYRPEFLISGVIWRLDIKTSSAGLKWSQRYGSFIKFKVLPVGLRRHEAVRSLSASFRKLEGCSEILKGPRWTHHGLLLSQPSIAE